MTLLRTFYYAVIAATTALSTQANATVLSPVNITVGKQSRAATLQVKNDGDTQQVMDVRVYKWVDVNADGSDVLEATDAVVPSRPVLMIEPSQTSTLRFLVSRTPGVKQENYRVVLTDITPSQAQHLSVRIRHVLPLFVVSDDATKAILEINNGVVTNVGERHARIMGYQDLLGKKVNTLRYVLPGKSVKLPVKAIEDITFNDTLY